MSCYYSANPLDKKPSETKLSFVQVGLSGRTQPPGIREGLNTQQTTPTTSDVDASSQMSYIMEEERSEEISQSTRMQDEDLDMESQSSNDADVNPSRAARLHRPQLNAIGVYDLICSPFPGDLLYEPSKSRLALGFDSTHFTVWGSFELGERAGIICMKDTVNFGTRTNFYFGWRARNVADPGEFLFGRRCFGDIIFPGGDEIAGSFYDFFGGLCHFRGIRRQRPLGFNWDADKFLLEWNRYRIETYGS